MVLVIPRLLCLFCVFNTELPTVLHLFHVFRILIPLFHIENGHVAVKYLQVFLPVIQESFHFLHYFNYSSSIVLTFIMMLLLSSFDFKEHLMEYVYVLGLNQQKPLTYLYYLLFHLCLSAGTLLIRNDNLSDSGMG